MPIIKAPTVRVGSQVVNEFVDTVGISDITYTFPDSDTRDTLNVFNISTGTLIVTVNGVATTIQPFKNATITDNYTQFSVRSTVGIAAFRVRASFNDMDEEDEETLKEKLQGKTNIKERKFDSLKIPIANGYDYAPVINAALASPFKYIFVPDGDYLVNSSILIPSDTTLVLSYNANIIRNFSGGGSSVATIRNKSLSSTTRDKNIGLFGGCIKAADSSKTGKHIVFWGVDVAKLSFKTREVYGDWSTNFRDCTDVIGNGIDIDTKGADIFTDGLHITGGKRYVFSNLIIKSGDDCISLTVETAEDTDIDGVTITNANLTTARSSIIKMTTKTGTTPTIKNVKITNIVGIGGTTGAGESIVLKDEDNAGRISDITIDVTVDCINGAGAGCRVQGVNNLFGKATMLNPQGKGADLSYMIGGDFTVTVKGQRTAGVSAVTMSQISDFDLTPNVEGATLHGVAVGAAGLPVTNCRIRKGRVKGSANTDIRLVNATGVKVENNYCTGVSGIVEDSGSDYNTIRNNDVRGVTGASKIAANGANTTIPNSNIGYKTYNRGTFSLPSSSTSVTVPHGLGTNPSSAGIAITLTGPKGSSALLYVDTSLSDATNFVVKADVAPGVIVPFLWSAVTSKYA